MGLLLPVTLPLAWHTRKTALRLPEATGPNNGFIDNDADKTITLAILGESTAAGVGTDDHQQGLAAAIARQLAHRLKCNVNWRAIGENGIDIQGAIDRLLPKIMTNPPNYLVICLGVNDTTGLTSIKNWQRRISTLIHPFRGRSHIYFNSTPPMEKFTALPQPLRFLMGFRAKILNRSLNDHPQQGNAFQCIPAVTLTDPKYLAIDGYHPSFEGYQAWGTMIADHIAETHETIQQEQIPNEARTDFVRRG